MDPQHRLHPTFRAALVLLALLLAGCGGSGSQSGGDATAVRADIQKALTTTGRDICELRRYATQRFVDQDSFSIPELAELNAKTCRSEVGMFGADAVTLSRVKVDGDRATARLAADGGAFDYGVLDLALVHDGTWKLDRVTAVDLDRRKFDALQQRLARVDPQPLPAKVKACFDRSLARRSDAQLERAIVRSDSTLLSDPVLGCVVRPQLRSALAPELASCVIGQLRRHADELLRVLLREDDDASEQLFKRAAEVCGGEAGTTI